MTLRRTPEDFRVVERPDPAVVGLFRAQATEGANVAVYEVTKTSLTTPEMLPRVAKAVGVKPDDKAVLSYAGLKDKHAVTTQLVSVRVKDGESRAWPAEFSGPAVIGKLVGFASGDAEASWIDRNEFTLVVRDLSPGAVREMGRRASLINLPQESAEGTRTLLVVNAFGEQRFGSARHGEGFAGKLLAKGDFEGALKLLIGTPARKDSGARREFTRILAEKWGQWKACLRHMPKCAQRGAIEQLAEGNGFREAFAALPYLDQEMAVEAYQSYLWNETTAELVKGLEGAEPIETDYGVIPGVPSKSVPEAMRGMKVPTPAAGMKPVGLGTGQVGEAIGAVLKREGLRTEELRVPGLRRPSFDVVERELFVRAEAFSIGKAEADELSKPGRVKATVKFALPRGAYATVVMRVLGQ